MPGHNATYVHELCGVLERLSLYQEVVRLVCLRRRCSGPGSSQPHSRCCFKRCSRTCPRQHRCPWPRLLPGSSSLQSRCPPQLLRFLRRLLSLRPLQRDPLPHSLLWQQELQQSTRSSRGRPTAPPCARARRPPWSTHHRRGSRRYSKPRSKQNMQVGARRLNIIDAG